MTQLIGVAIVAALFASQPNAMSSPGAVHAIGPKQDDPRAACDAGDGKRSIIVQGGREAIGPKQDDPRSSANATMGTYNPDTHPQAAGTRCVKKKKD